MVSRLRLYDLNFRLNPTVHIWFMENPKIPPGTRNRAYSLCTIWDMGSESKSKNIGFLETIQPDWSGGNWYVRSIKDNVRSYLILKYTKMNPTNSVLPLGGVSASDNISLNRKISINTGQKSIQHVFVTYHYYIHLLSYWWNRSDLPTLSSVKTGLLWGPVTSVLLVIP